MTQPLQPVDASPAPLTSRQRLLRALRGEPADRVPVWLMRQAGRYLPQYHDVRRHYDFLALCKTPEAAATVSIQPVELLGSDAVIIFNDIMLPLEHAGGQVEFDDKGPIIHNPVRTPGELAALQAHPVSSEEPVARTIREVRRRLGEDVPILGFIGAPWTLATYWVEGRVGKAFDHIGALRYSDPQLLDALLEKITAVAADYLQIQIDAGADAVQIFDTWGGNLSAADYERFSGRWIRRIIEQLRTPRPPVIVYVNGCALYLDQLAALGADALSVDWRLELSAARRAVGAKMALQGNLNPQVLLAGPQATEQAVLELFRNFPPGPGHVFNLGHGILPKTPVASVRRLFEVVKHHGTY